eukprot:scaffold1846_cov236-Pinguiococcus_pyrenoidosus.AAC.3
MQSFASSSPNFTTLLRATDMAAARKATQGKIADEAEPLCLLRIHLTRPVSQIRAAGHPQRNARCLCLRVEEKFLSTEDNVHGPDHAPRETLVYDLPPTINNGYGPLHQQEHGRGLFACAKKERSLRQIHGSHDACQVLEESRRCILQLAHILEEPTGQQTLRAPLFFTTGLAHLDPGSSPLRLSAQHLEGELLEDDLVACSCDADHLCRLVGTQDARGATGVVLNAGLSEGVSRAQYSDQSVFLIARRLRFQRQSCSGRSVAAILVLPFHSYLGAAGEDHVHVAIPRALSQDHFVRTQRP